MTQEHQRWCVGADYCYGYGGWDEGVIQSLKTTVNMRMCRGPLSIMEALTEEMQRLQAGGLAVPTTPTLPKKSK